MNITNYHFVNTRKIKSADSLTDALLVKQRPSRSIYPTTSRAVRKQNYYPVHLSFETLTRQRSGGSGGRLNFAARSPGPDAPPRLSGGSRPPLREGSWKTACGSRRPPRPAGRGLGLGSAGPTTQHHPPSRRRPLPQAAITARTAPALRRLCPLPPSPLLASARRPPFPGASPLAPPLPTCPEPEPSPLPGRPAGPSSPQRLSASPRLPRPLLARCGGPPAPGPLSPGPPPAHPLPPSLLGQARRTDRTTSPLPFRAERGRGHASTPSHGPTGRAAPRMRGEGEYACLRPGGAARSRRARQPSPWGARLALLTSRRGRLRGRGSCAWALR